MKASVQRSLAAALWKLYYRTNDPPLWERGADFPWHDPDFGRRTLGEHLDESHGAASRSTRERMLQLDWLWHKLGLTPGARVLDITCGPGLYAVELARRGCTVTGIDINPAAISFARELARTEGVAGRCSFFEHDVRQINEFHRENDVLLFLYEQLAVYSKKEAQLLLNQMADMLKSGGQLVIELLNQDNVDKKDSSWWFTDDTGLWGDAPFLHLGERVWNDEAEASIESYHILHLDTGEMKQYTLFDQTYAVETMVQMLIQAGFGKVDYYLNWGGLPLYDASEWVVYIAEK